MTADIDRGWGGIVAWLVAAVICAAIALGHSWWEARKIDNPSPTAGEEGEGDAQLQVSGQRGRRGAPLPEGDVDLDEWLLANCETHSTWTLAQFGAAEFGVTKDHVIERMDALGLYS